MGLWAVVGVLIVIVIVIVVVGCVVSCVFVAMLIGLFTYLSTCWLVETRAVTDCTVLHA